MIILSRDNCKKIDYETINKIGIPSIVLMENAATEIVNIIKDIGNRVTIFCGVGNNGGDGLAIARKLHLLDKNVEVILVGDRNKLTHDCSLNLQIVKNLNIPIINIKDNCSKEYIIEKVKCSDYIVDSIFGIGLNRDILGIYKDIIEIINEFSKFIVAVDIPSGMDADTGKELNISVKANLTCTVEVMKKGFMSTKAIDLTGDIKIINIGIPNYIKEQNSEKTYILSKEKYKRMIPIRKKTGHKGNYGKILIVAGSEKYYGAAFITTEACVRTGSGLVTLLTHKEAFNALRGRFTEAMIQEYSSFEDVESLKGFDVIACGPGLGKGEDSKAILKKVIEETNCKLVLDADALNIISENKDLLIGLRGRTVITPHPGEMARLVGQSISEIEADRIGVAKEFAKKNNIIVLLKGYNTVITDGESVFINRTGNSKMASGGMGDCLTGIIASFVGQKDNVMEATLLGAYVHGYTGDYLSKSNYIVNARDVIEYLPKTIEKLCEN